MLFLLPFYIPASCRVASPSMCLISYEGHKVSRYIYFSVKAAVFNVQGLGVSLIRTDPNEISDNIAFCK